MDNRAPVLVIQRDGYGDVAIARTLGRLGVPVYLLAHEGMATPAYYSRYWAGKSLWDFSKPENESISRILDAGRAIQADHGERPILLTMADWVAILIERHGDALEPQFVFPRAAQPVIRSLANKWEMHLLANEHGVPTPTTIRPGSRSDVEEFLEAATFPIVLKPADPYLPHAPSKQIIDSRQELMDEIDREMDSGSLNFVLQEYIPGDAESVWMCNGYFGPEPERTVVLTGKKLRQVSSTGVASLAICLPNDTVAMQTRSLMEGVGYRGCVGIGYRYDSRDGLYKLLDVNARVSAVFRLFRGSNDMDVVRICYLDLTNQTLPETTLRAGRKWMLEDDVIAAFTAVRKGRLTLAQWLSSVRGVQELHWFAADDPMPLISWLRINIGRWALARRRRKSTIEPR
jgi:D-aspartate ligase